jgi:hypothetical protein
MIMWSTNLTGWTPPSLRDSSARQLHMFQTEAARH